MSFEFLMKLAHTSPPLASLHPLHRIQRKTIASNGNGHGLTKLEVALMPLPFQLEPEMLNQLPFHSWFSPLSVGQKLYLGGSLE